MQVGEYSRNYTLLLHFPQVLLKLDTFTKYISKKEKKTTFL